MNYSKSPRIYVTDDLSSCNNILLSRDHSHYLMNVLRKNDGDIVRIFNGRDGEFSGKIAVESKKTITLKWLEKIKDQPKPSRRIHLYCPPIKKDRFAFLIEKAVELGVTDIYPIATDRTQNAKINSDKIERYIIEAAEQCERLDIPTLHNLNNLKYCNFETNTYCAIERHDAPLFHTQTDSDTAIIIGPEGGWTNDEIEYLTNHDNVTIVSLGENILRAETAAIFMLSRIV